MKRRRNQLVAIECADIDGETPIALRPFILAGGEYAEPNCAAMIENMSRIYGGNWSARVVYHWRSHQHLRRWLDRNEKWRA